jgi:hypothetical protein
MVQKESKILTFWAKSRNQLATDELMAPSTHLYIIANQYLTREGYMHATWQQQQNCVNYMTAV